MGDAASETILYFVQSDGIDDISKLKRVMFGQRAIDIDVGTDFEAGSFGQPRDDGNIPVVVFVWAIDGGGADDKVVIRCVEQSFLSFEHEAQDFGKRRDLFI